MRWSKSENLICEELIDGALLVDTTTGRRWTLNATATALWKLRGVNSSVEKFCSQVQASTMCPLAILGGPAIKPMGLGSGPRRRPSPRGNSGPG